MELATKRLLANHVKRHILGDTFAVVIGSNNACSHAHCSAAAPVPAARKDLFQLPALDQSVNNGTCSDSDLSDDDEDDNGMRRERQKFVFLDTSSVDVTSPEFDQLPLEIQACVAQASFHALNWLQHEIILDVKERKRKQEQFATDADRFSQQQVGGVDFVGIDK